MSARVCVCEGVGAQEKGEWKHIWWMSFVSIYENRRMKTWNLRNGGEGERENDGGVNLSKIYCKHVHKYHSIFPCTTIMW
jgi:hypothetical protein